MDPIHSFLHGKEDIRSWKAMTVKEQLKQFIISGKWTLKRR